MPTPYETHRRVFRHASDNQAYDCGRACAQMIITALSQGVPAGTTPSPVQEAQPVPVVQDDLREREKDKIDVPGRWFTDPDELAALLNEDQTLKGLGYSSWRVAACPTFEELLQHIGAAIQNGVPAVLNIRCQDHWVVVHGVDYDSGMVSFLRMLDPQLAYTAPGPTAHTYVDGCARDGAVWWSVIDEPKDVVASWQVAVGTYPPAHYAGQCVAIVHGEAPRTLADWLTLRNRIRKLQRRPRAPTPPLRIREELLRVSRLLNDPQFSALVERDAPLHVRYVHDIAAKLRGYTLASFYDAALGRGLIGVFDVADQRFRHVRLTADRTLIDSIAGDVAEPLWWTRQRLATLHSPYFPFIREKDADGRLTYRRLIDGQTLAPPPAAPEAGRG